MSELYTCHRPPYEALCPAAAGLQSKGLGPGLGTARALEKHWQQTKMLELGVEGRVSGKEAERRQTMTYQRARIFHVRVGVVSNGNCTEDVQGEARELSN